MELKRICSFKSSNTPIVVGDEIFFIEGNRFLKGNLLASKYAPIVIHQFEEKPWRIQLSVNRIFVIDNNLTIIGEYYFQDKRIQEKSEINFSVLPYEKSHEFLAIQKGNNIKGIYSLKRIKKYF